MTSLRGWLGFVEAASLEWLQRPVVKRAALRDMLATMLVQTVTVASEPLRAPLDS